MEGKWSIPFHPCIAGKCATSNRGMLHINPLNFLTEVHLLTLFPLSTEETSYGEILIKYIHPSIEKLIRRGNGESHSPHTEWNGPSLSEM